MKNTELMGFFVKILSVYVLIQSLQGLTASVGAIFYEPQTDLKGLEWMIYLTAAGYSLGFFAAIVMWKFPITISKWFVPKCADNRFSNLDLKVDSIEVVAFSIIGIFIISQVIPILFNQVGSLIIYSSNIEIISPEVLSRMKLGIVSSIIKVVIGLILCVFSGNLKLLLISIRTKVAEMGSR